MSLSQQFQQSSNTSFRDAIFANPKAPIQELIDMVQSNASLHGLTFGEVIMNGAAKPSNGVAKASAAPKNGKAKKLSPPKAGKVDGSIDVRTDEGRAALDARVLATLKELGGSKVSANAIRDAIPGLTGNQCRAAMDRLIQAGSASYSGKARGMVYHLS